jgi:hypothetical protein
MEWRVREWREEAGEGTYTKKRISDILAALDGKGE